MEVFILIVFILGYLAITLEHNLKIDKLKSGITNPVHSTHGMQIPFFFKQTLTHRLA